MTGHVVSRNLIKAALLLAVLGTARSAGAAPAPTFVSVRQAFAPVATTVQGASGLYLNADPGEHAVRSDLSDPATHQPLFSSPVAGIGEAVEVRGVETLAPGTYEFYCTYHTTMRGTLVVLDQE